MFLRLRVEWKHSSFSSGLTAGEGLAWPDPQTVCLSGSSHRSLCEHEKSVAYLSFQALVHLTPQGKAPKAQEWIKFLFLFSVASRRVPSTTEAPSALTEMSEREKPNFFSVYTLYY